MPPEYHRWGIYKPAVSKLTIALWYVFITFSWEQPRYHKLKCLNILITVG